MFDMRKLEFRRSALTVIVPLLLLNSALVAGVEYSDQAAGNAASDDIDPHAHH